MAMTPARQEAERLAGEALPCNSHLGHRHLNFHPEDCPAFYIPAIADLIEGERIMAELTSKAAQFGAITPGQAEVIEAAREWMKMTGTGSRLAGREKRLFKAIANLDAEERRAAIQGALTPSATPKEI